MTEERKAFANYCVFIRSVALHAQMLFEDSTAADRARMSSRGNFGATPTSICPYGVLASGHNTALGVLNRARY